MQTRILTLFTRTPLHVGAGSSVGAIDQPIIRERHTRFPVIPGSSLKGVLASLWDDVPNERNTEAVWLFGSPDAKNASAGALLVGEAKLLAFPVRSAKGCFAWLTCPLALSRLARDRDDASLKSAISNLQSQMPSTDNAIVPATTMLALENKKVVEGREVVDYKVVFEEYALGASTANLEPLLTALSVLCRDDVWKQLEGKLAIVSDELFAHFAEQACEVAQHIRIDDESGTVANGALFNQENVPSEALFYSVVSAQAGKGAAKDRTPDQALSTLGSKLESFSHLLQIGADETTGLGWCSTHLVG